MPDIQSYPALFSQMTGIDGREILEAKPAPRDTDRGIMMLALRCLANGVMLTEDEQAQLKEAMFRGGTIYD